MTGVVIKARSIADGPVDTSFVRWISDVGESASSGCGRKGAQLAKLAEHGFDIPEGFCVTSEAYELHADPLFPQSDELIKNERSLAVDYWDMLNAELEPQFVDKVLHEYRNLKKTCPGPVAVRSSSSLEDLDRQSFAGQYETNLNVSEETELLNAIRRCWASYWSQEAARYREEAGIDHGRYSMAVIVQTMVRSKFAGVLFTQSTTYQHLDAAVIEFVSGTGEDLVGGDARARRCVVDRGSRRLLSCNYRNSELDSDLLDRLLSLSFEIEKHMGGPQDIEWSIDEADRIWFLQTRPITRTLHTQTSAPQAWERIYGEPFSPLGCDLAIRRHSVWVEAINRFHSTGFESEAEVVDGFLFHNPSWRSPGWLLRLRMLFWKISRWLGAARNIRNYLDSALPKHLQLITKIEQADLTRLDLEALMRNLDVSIQAYLNLQRTSYPAIALATTSVSILDRLCRLFFRKGVKFRAPDFLAGLDNLTVDRDLRLYELGQSLIKLHPADEISILDHAAPAAPKLEDSAANKMQLRLQRFVNLYGYIWADRYPRDPAWELKLDALTASLEQVKKSAHNGSGLPAHHKGQKQKRVQAVTTAREQLSVVWLLFRPVLRRAEKLFPHKEDRNHYVYHAVAVIRKCALEIGRRLEARDVLESERDIFFLTWSEIREIILRNVDSTIFRHAIASRKLTYHQSRQASRVQSAARQLAANDRPGTIDVSDCVFEGDPCSSGIATGRARLVRGFGELDEVKPGDIMVCSNMRPAWSTVLGRAGGIVVETGSLLSHGATLAREYGVPAVMNVPGITQIVHDGDRITVDGYNGTLSIERV